MNSFVSERYPAPFFPFKEVSDRFPFTNIFWVGALCGYYASGPDSRVCVGCVHMCVCVCNHNACFFSVLETTFYGHNLQAKSPFGSPKGQLSTTVHLPGPFCATRKKNNNNNRSVLSTGLWDESRNFLTHCTTSELQCQVHRGESRYRNLVHRPQLLKTDFWWPENNVGPKYSLLQNYLKELG